MIHKPLRWSVTPDTNGPELEAAVEAMNRHGPFTVDDALSSEAPRRVELVGGWFRIVNLPSPAHELVISLLSQRLQDLVGERGFVLGGGVRTSGDLTLREPDLAVYVDRTRAELLAKPHWSLVPDLVVEVLSPSNAAEDRGPKRAEYAAAGVREYMLVDPDARTVEVLRLEQGHYVPVARSSDGWPSVVLGCTWRPEEALGS